MIRAMSVALLALIITLSPGAGAATETGLGTLLQAGLDSNPRIIEARAHLAQMEFAAARVSAAMGWRIDTNADITTATTPKEARLPYDIMGQDIPETMTVHVATAVLSKGLPWTTKNRIPRNQAELGIESGREQLRLAESGVARDISRAYYDMFKARDALSVSKLALEDAERALEIAIEKWKAGTAAESQVMAARSRLSEARAATLRAERGHDLGARLLSSLTGMKAIDLKALPAPRIDELISKAGQPWPWSADDSIALALEHRPEMRLAELGIAGAQLEREQAMADARPQVNISANYNWAEESRRVSTNLNLDGRWSVAVSTWQNTMPELSWPETSQQNTWDWDRVKGIWDRYREPLDTWEIRMGITFSPFDSGLRMRAVDQAGAKIDQARAKAEGARDLVELDVLQAYSRYLDADKAVGLARSRLTEALASREESLAAKGYGALTKQDENRLDLLVNQRQAEYNSALYDLAFAKFSLGLSMGMGPQVILDTLGL